MPLKPLQSSIMKILSLFLFVLFTMLAACAPTQNTTSGGLNESTPELKLSTGTVEQNIKPDILAKAKNSECPALDRQLYQLSLADDPTKRAAELGFRTVGNKVQVVMLLDSDDTTFLTNFGVEIGSSSGRKVQAFVPFDQLCALAKQESIISIRAAIQISP